MRYVFPLTVTVVLLVLTGCSTSGSGSHPDQPPANQQATTSERRGPTSEARRITFPAQDKNLTRAPAVPQPVTAAKIKEHHARHRRFQILHGGLEPARREKDAHVSRGNYRIAFPKRKPHDLRVDLRQAITKGASDVEVVINDLTAGTTTTLNWSEENAAAEIGFGGQAVPFAVNADNTLSVAGQTYPDVESAGAALARRPELAGMSVETLAALEETMIESLGVGSPSAKWAVAVPVLAGVVVGTVGIVLCIVLADGAVINDDDVGLCIYAAVSVGVAVGKWFYEVAQ
jgi:hypothetical protein